MKKNRLDDLLVRRGLVEETDLARALIMSGDVFVEGKRLSTPGVQVSEDAQVEVRGKQEFVSRGGIKLQSALDYFGVSPDGKVCIDCGASTGGFTDCLLKNGARMVYAVDVGYGQLAWRIRNDSRIITMERTNIRYVKADNFDTKPDLATIDVSFISLALVLPVVKELLATSGEAICLIKPQFEAERECVGEKGVVHNPQTHVDVLEAFIRNAEQSGFRVNGLTYSPIKGPEGNIEYFGWLSLGGDTGNIDVVEVVRQAHEKTSNK